MNFGAYCSSLGKGSSSSRQILLGDFLYHIVSPQPEFDLKDEELVSSAHWVIWVWVLKRGSFENPSGKQCNLHLSFPTEVEEMGIFFSQGKLYLRSSLVESCFWGLNFLAHPACLFTGWVSPDLWPKRPGTAWHVGNLCWLAQVLRVTLAAHLYTSLFLNHEFTLTTFTNVETNVWNVIVLVN